MENAQQLIKGQKVSLRLWDETEVHGKPAVSRPYETAGYVLEGTATLDLDGKKQTLNKGEAYLVPAGAKHSYDITGHFRCVEATSI